MARKRRHTARTAARRGFVAVWAALATLLVLVRAASAGPVCVVDGDAGASGVAPLLAELDTAWAIETRKAGLAVDLVHAGDTRGCPPNASLVVRVVGDARAVFEGSDGARSELVLAGLTRWERARTLARTAVERLRADAAGDVAFSVDVSAEEPPAAPAVAPYAVAPSNDAPFRLGVAVGTFYALHGAPAQHRGGAEAEGLVTLLDDALVIGLRVGWTADEPIAGGDAHATWTSVAFGPHVRWGFRLEPDGWRDRLWLRVGLGLEADRRWLQVYPKPYRTRVDVSRWSVATAFEVELVWEIQRRFQAGLTVGGRLYSFTEDYVDDAERLYDAPDGAFQVVLRYGWLFD